MLLLLKLSAGYTRNARNVEEAAGSGAPAEHGARDEEGQVDQGQLFPVGNYVIADYLVSRWGTAKLGALVFSSPVR